MAAKVNRIGHYISVIILKALGYSLHGYEDNDRLDGGAGDDWLVGGTGDDIFVFKANGGWDGIADFEVHNGSTSGDVIELHDQSVSNFTDLMANAVEWNGTSYIQLDNGDGMTLHGVTLNELTADDFSFV
ncbi:MAG: hypothetical protein HRU28_18670 [Rhizobiales bacterium]|nr:hypothetical protein [Hyphomicrobiales bacterium]